MQNELVVRFKLKLWKIQKFLLTRTNFSKSRRMFHIFFKLIEKFSQNAKLLLENFRKTTIDKFAILTRKKNHESRLKTKKKRKSKDVVVSKNKSTKERDEKSKNVAISKNRLEKKHNKKLKEIAISQKFAIDDSI